MPKFGAYAALLAVLVTGSASAMPSSASAAGLPTRSAPALTTVADAGQTAGPPSITAQPAASWSPTLDPTPGTKAPAEEIGARPISITPPAAAPAGPAVPAASVPVASVVLPTIQDAKDYLVARLGAKVDRRWGFSQSQCASLIFEEEAQWDPHATNRSSGAYGLPQANPASKLGDWAEARADAAEKADDPEAARLYRAWRDNPVVQAEWGVDYMTTRYGSPCAALTFRNGHWEGGVLIPGVGWY